MPMEMAQGDALPIDSSALLFVQQSPPLSAIVEATNTHSVNLFAEALLRIIAIDQGRPGTIADGIKAIKDHWTDAIQTPGWRLTDGSGLSRSNAASAAWYCELLTHLADSSKFVESLPVAGSKINNSSTN